MTRLTPVQPEQTKDSVKGTLDELAARGGALGPMVLTMANSSALVRGYADLNRAMKPSHLDRRITERISLAVQEWLGCAYCIDAHSDAARGLRANRHRHRARAPGNRHRPQGCGHRRLRAAGGGGTRRDRRRDVETLRRFGYRDEQIADIVGLVALNVLTGSFNLVAGIEPADARQRCLSAA
jgi:AhpD family alkylhydroperoxidase